MFGCRLLGHGPFKNVGATPMGSWDSRYRPFTDMIWHHKSYYKQKKHTFIKHHQMWYLYTNVCSLKMCWFGMTIRITRWPARMENRENRQSVWGEGWSCRTLQPIFFRLCLGVSDFDRIFFAHFSWLKVKDIWTGRTWKHLKINMVELRFVQNFLLEIRALDGFRRFFRKLPGLYDTHASTLPPYLGFGLHQWDRTNLMFQVNKIKKQPNWFIDRHKNKSLLHQNMLALL